MQKLDSRITRLEPDNSVAVCIDHEDVPASWIIGCVNFVEYSLLAGSSSCSLSHDLSDMFMNVIGTGPAIEVVDHDLDDAGNYCV